VLETVGFDARGRSGRRPCFDVPAGFRNSVNYRLRMLLIAAYSTGRHQK
jgi:hypothetical protein